MLFPITANNVNDAYRKGLLMLLSSDAQEMDSRAGRVRVMPGPVMTQTLNPDRCVLLDLERRANPFFHVYEALWMLCGSSDARRLDRYVSDFSARFAESSGRQHGAYGHRWRNHFEMDQLDECIARLRKNYEDRRVVLTMWDPNEDLGADVRDVPCNTHIYPRVRPGMWGHHKSQHFLDLTVCCRSNDAIWGAHGANAVHFSFLLQYMAAKIGVQIGTLFQLSNNYHVYLDTMKTPSPLPINVRWDRMTPLIGDPQAFYRDANLIVENPDILGPELSDHWTRTVALPMLRAHDAWRERDREVWNMHVASINCPVWRRAVEQWWPE